MADTRISELAALAPLAAADELVVVDKSDTSEAASGTNKKTALDDLRNWLAPSALVLQTTGGTGAATAPGTYFWVPGGTSAIASGGAASSTLFAVLNAADWPNVDSLNLQVSLVTNVAQTGVTFTFGLYPVSVSGTTTLIWTMGTVVTGSTVAFTAPGAGSESRGNSGNFAFPAADAYLIGLSTNAATAAASRTAWTCTLRGVPT